MTPPHHLIGCEVLGVVIKDTDLKWAFCLLADYYSLGSCGSDHWAVRPCSSDANLNIACTFLQAEKKREYNIKKKPHVTPTVANKIYYFTEMCVSKLKLIIIYVADSKIQTRVSFSFISLISKAMQIRAKARLCVCVCVWREREVFSDKLTLEGSGYTCSSSENEQELSVRTR